MSRPRQRPPPPADCWHPGHDAVTVEQVIATFTANVGNAKSILKSAVSKVAALGVDTPYDNSMTGAIMTRKELIPASLRDELAPIIAKYL